MLIYLIRNTVNSKVYVGQTKKTAEARFKGHCGKARSVTKKQALHYAMLKHGESSFFIEVLQVCGSQQELDEAEKQWIVKLSAKAPNGYNVKDGGYSNIPTGESRRNISWALTGRKASPETCLRISKAKKGFSAQTAEAKAKMSASHLLRWDDKTRAAQSLAQTGRTHSEETKAKMVKSMTGLKRIPRTDEARANQSKGQLGGKHSEETRKKISEFNKGKVFSAEARANMAKSHQTRHAKNRLAKLEALKQPTGEK